MDSKLKVVKEPTKNSLINDEDFNKLVSTLGLAPTAYSPNNKEALIDTLIGPNSKNNKASSKAKVFLLGASVNDPLTTTCLQVMALNGAGRGHINTLNMQNVEFARKLSALDWQGIVKAATPQAPTVVGSSSF